MFVRKLVLANQRSERWFSDVKKMIRPIRIANDFFHVWEKWYVQSEVTWDQAQFERFSYILSNGYRWNSPCPPEFNFHSETKIEPDLRLNQKPQRCVSFAPKFPPFITACSAASHTFNEKTFPQIDFLTKKWKTFRKWSGIVSFVSLSIKKTVESRRNNSGKT